jgi:hypothetical protein
LKKGSCGYGRPAQTAAALARAEVGQVLAIVSPAVDRPESTAARGDEGKREPGCLMPGPPGVYEVIVRELATTD